MTSISNDQKTVELINLIYVMAQKRSKDPIIANILDICRDGAKKKKKSSIR